MRLGILLYVIFMLSCQSKLDTASYMNLLNKSELVQIVETDSFSYTLKLLPAGFMALKSENVHTADIDDVLNEFSEETHFHLGIEDKYPDRLKKPSTSMYYLTEFQKRLSLNQDSILSYYHHEASHIKDRETFLFGFPRETTSDITVTIKEHLMDVNLKFTFPGEEILKFDNMEGKL